MGIAAIQDSSWANPANQAPINARQTPIVTRKTSALVAVIIIRWAIPFVVHLQSARRVLPVH